MFEILSNVENLKNFIVGTGSKGVIVYIIIQFLQVIILPIPAAIICLAGALIYGPLLGSIYCSVGILLGSYCSFLIGKVFGYKIVSFVVGTDNANKYANIIEYRGRGFLAIAFLLPLFPDDILCSIAGLSSMKFKTFFIITTLTRPVGTICMSYFGGGHIIPFSGWGIYLWIVILIAVVIIMIVMYKYQKKFETWVISKLKTKN